MPKHTFTIRVRVTRPSPCGEIGDEVDIDPTEPTNRQEIASGRVTPLDV